MRIKIGSFELVIHRRSDRPSWRGVASISTDRLLRLVCDYYHVSKARARSKARHRVLVKARALYCYLGRVMGYSNEALASTLHRDRCTVIHHYNKYQDLLNTEHVYYDKDLATEVGDVKMLLTSIDPI